MKKTLLFFVFSMYTAFGFTQPKGQANELFTLINEARTNPKAFLSKYKIKINEYNPKLVDLLEKSAPIEKLIWDEDLAKNCKQSVYGNLNPEYKGIHKICGFSSGNGSGYSNKEPLYFLCDSYTHIMDEDDLYFGFYLDSKGHAYVWGKSCNRKKYTFEFNEIIDSSKVDFKRISTASRESEMNAMDKEMIKEINFVRQYPKVYASIVAAYLANESKKRRGLSKAEYEAGIELISELKTMIPRQLLYPEKCVYEAAKKHGEDCKKRGYSSHTGSDNSSPFTRISSFCTNWVGNENIVGGQKNARILVIQLLIDSGISSRGHRYNMLDSKWQYVGCYGYEGVGMYQYIQNFAKEK